MQLFEFLDMDLTDMDVFVNNQLADNDTKVYENFSVSLKPKFKDTFENVSEDTFGKSFEDTSGNTSEYISEDISEDTFQDENVIMDADTNSQLDDQTADTITIKPQQKKTDNTKVADGASVTKEILILINHEPVRLYGKKEYILVDLFQFYKFDLSKPQGNIVLKLNGQSGDYTAPLKDGDIVDLYWEK